MKYIIKPIAKIIMTIVAVILVTIIYILYTIFHILWNLNFKINYEYWDHYSNFYKEPIFNGFSEKNKGNYKLFKSYYHYMLGINKY